MKLTVLVIAVLLGAAYADLQVVSVAKTATQSSLFNTAAASRALDGNTNSYWVGNTCTHTQAAEKSWWTVNLGSKRKIVAVKIWNRRDCCSERLSDVVVEVTSPGTTYTQCGQYEGSTKNRDVITIDCKAEAQYVRISVSGSNRILTLCEVEVLGYAENLLSKNKPASHVSNLNTGVASRAVDGNTAQEWTQNSCTHTDLADTPWWQVDLGQSSRISRVKVYNRKDCCGERLASFEVMVGPTSKGPWTVCATGPSTINNGDIFDLSCDAAGRFVRIQLPSKGYLTLCEVEVYGHALTLLSEKKTADQSDTASGAVASRAVDGNTDQDFDKGSCTHTNSVDKPFWRVDLGELRAVSSVVVYNRADCCGNRLSNFIVEVSDNKVGPYVQCASFPQTTTDGEIITVICDTLGRHVRISLPGKEYLTLCEVQVYGL